MKKIKHRHKRRLKQRVWKLEWRFLENDSGLVDSYSTSTYPRLVWVYR